MFCEFLCYLFIVNHSSHHCISDLELVLCILFLSVGTQTFVVVESFQLRREWEESSHIQGEVLDINPLVE